MPNSTIHKVLVTTGCLLWCSSFFGELANQQPYSTAGLIISPILTVVGIFYWFKYYRATRGHNPKFKPVWDIMTKFDVSFISRLEFMLKHFLEFATVWVICFMGMVLLSVLTFRRSDAFEATKQYCQSNQDILSQTGDIKYYGVMVAGTTSFGGQGGSADLSFTIVGTKGNFSANSKLTMQNGKWTVDKLEFR
jgi:hypothetical protein